MIQIYNEAILDILESLGTTSGGAPAAKREPASYGANSGVSGLFQEVARADEAVALVIRGAQNRKVRQLVCNGCGFAVVVAGPAKPTPTGSAADAFAVASPSALLNTASTANNHPRPHAPPQTASTNKNETSSRSHFICRLIIQSVDAGGTRLESNLMLVDLAGSESGEAVDVGSENAGQRQAEGRNINQSLLALQEAFRTVVKKQREEQQRLRKEDDEGVDKKTAREREREREKEQDSYVGFNNSKLTRVLKASAAGSAAASWLVLLCFNLTFTATRNLGHKPQT